MYRLNIPQPKGDVLSWLEDRGVQKGLVDSLAETQTPELKLQSAAWLQQSSLPKIVEARPHLPTFWNSHRWSALEALAYVTRDLSQDSLMRRLAKSILAQDDFILRLWNITDEYTPLVFELLIALDKRLCVFPVLRNSTEWQIVD